MMAPRRLNMDCPDWGKDEDGGLCVCGKTGRRLASDGTAMKVGGPYSSHPFCEACGDVAVRPTILLWFLNTKAAWQEFVYAWVPLCEKLLLPLEPWTARRCSVCSHAGAGIQTAWEWAMESPTYALALLFLCRTMPVDAEVNRELKSEYEPLFRVATRGTSEAVADELLFAFSRKDRCTGIWEEFKSMLVSHIVQQCVTPPEILLMPCPTNECFSDGHDRLGFSPFKFGPCVACGNRECVDMTGELLRSPSPVRYCSHCFLRVGAAAVPGLVKTQSPAENDAARVTLQLAKADAEPLWWTFSFGIQDVGLVALARGQPERVGADFVEWLVCNHYDALAQALLDHLLVIRLHTDVDAFVKHLVDVVRATLVDIQAKEAKPCDYDTGVVLVDPFAGLGDMCAECGGMVGKPSFETLFEHGMLTCYDCGGSLCSGCARYGPLRWMLMTGRFYCVPTRMCLCEVSTKAASTWTQSGRLPESPRSL